MFKTPVILLLILIDTVCLFSQTNGVDFRPKMLQKELDKAGVQNDQLQELSVPANMARQVFSGKYMAITVHSPASGTKYIYIGRVHTCRAGGCSINRSQDSDKESEFFDYFILFDSTCAVQQVKVYNYQATHGQEVTAKNWLKQFRGYQGHAELTAGKNVDAISGATISVDAITFDIQHKTGLLKRLMENHAPLQSGALTIAK